MVSTEKNGEEEEGNVEGICPVWLCVALEKLVEGYPLVQKAARTLVVCCTKLSWNLNRQTLLNDADLEKRKPTLRRPHLFEAQVVPQISVPIT